MKENLDENKPSAKEIHLPEEFVYATRIVDMIKKVDLNKECDVIESIKMIQKTFLEYKDKNAKFGA